MNSNAIIQGPLKGIRVIEFGTTIAAPLAATLMADFGADVIKIEHPELGDPLRNWAPFKNDVPLTWKVAARNKRLVTLNLKHPDGQSLAKQLIKTGDVLIENFRPGTMERWGLGYADLKQINNRIIMLRISGYGQDGPFANRPGYGTIAEAMTGIPSFTGFPDTPPTLSAFPLADAVAAVFGVFGVLMAIYERTQNPNGAGQVIDVSLYEPLFRLVESQVIGYDQLGIIKQRRGNRMEEDVPRDAYRTRDNEWIAISASSDKTFTRLMEAIGHPELAKDPRFINNENRIKNEPALDKYLQEWFSSRTRKEAEETLESYDVVAGPILNIEDIFNHIQYISRKSIIEVPDHHFEKIKMQGVIPKLSRTPGKVRFSGQEKGHHNKEIFIDELGLTDVEYAELEAEGVI